MRQMFKEEDVVRVTGYRWLRQRSEIDARRSGTAAGYQYGNSAPWLPNSKVELFGRKDEQAKINDHN